MKPTLKYCIIALAVVSTLLDISSASACTRALFVGSDNTIITGRTMDWEEDMATDLWLFPRGITRNGEAGSNSLKWESKYGSVVASVYSLASADGMNEKGLVMNMLYLAESDYGSAKPDQPSMAISLWGQYVLDNFATVAEAVSALEASPPFLIAPTLPNGVKGQAHLSISDPSGDSAIVEYIGGKQTIHHGKEYTVMTNSPAYDKQLALNEYWTEINGAVFLPGTSRAADRFTRTSYYINNVPKQIDKSYIKSIPTQSFDYQAIAGVLSVMRANSVPFGVTTSDQPNIAATIWRTVSDQKNKVYYFDSSTRPNTFWVSFNHLNFNKGTPVQKLSLLEGEIYAGEVANQFKPATAFRFIGNVEVKTT
ncbi:MAG: linear amide C-N hydrolase [Legionella longbeachae]|nr:linear amide C-N hydrolase [Legionella longbeachae]